MQVVIPTGLLLSAACSAHSADSNPLLGDWEYDSQDTDCPIAGGAPPALFRVHFAKDSEIEQFQATFGGKARTITEQVSYVYVPSDPTHTVSVTGSGGYTRWIVVDAQHIKLDVPCHPVYRRAK
jgi:hypothetical protein